MLITIGYSNNLCVHSAAEGNFSYFQFFTVTNKTLVNILMHFSWSTAHESFSREICPSHLLFHKVCLSIAIYMAVARDQKLLRNSPLPGGKRNGQGRSGCLGPLPHAMALTEAPLTRETARPF